MDIIRGPAIRPVPDVHQQRPVPVPAVTMVRVAVMAVVQTLGHAVRRLRHVHVQLKPRLVIHCVMMSETASVQRRVQRKHPLQVVNVLVRVQRPVMGIILIRRVIRQVPVVQDAHRMAVVM